MVIAPDDFRVGYLVVISRGGPQVVLGPCGPEEIENRQYNGAVVRLVAISLPFVVVDLLGKEIMRTVLDARLWEFSRVSREYVEALHPEVFGTPTPGHSVPPVFSQQPAAIQEIPD